MRNETLKITNRKQKCESWNLPKKLEKFCGLNRNFDQKQAAYNSCLWLLWNLVELPFRMNFTLSQKLKGYELPQKPQAAGRYSQW